MLVLEDHIVVCSPRVRSSSCQSPPYSTPGSYPPLLLRLHDTDSSRSNYSLCRRLPACSLGLLCPLSTPRIPLELAHGAFQRLPSLLEPPSTQPLTLARPPQDLTAQLHVHRNICLGWLRPGALQTVGPSSPSSRSKQANNRHTLPSWAFRPCSVASPLLLVLFQRRQTLSQVCSQLSIETTRSYRSTPSPLKLGRVGSGTMVERLSNSTSRSMGVSSRGRRVVKVRVPHLLLSSCFFAVTDFERIGLVATTGRSRLIRYVDGFARSSRPQAVLQTLLVLVHDVRSSLPLSTFTLEV